MKLGFKTGFLVLVLAIVGTVFYFLVNLGDLVKTAVEEAGSAVAGVSVTLADAEVKPAEGIATLHGLTVGNPPGFKTANAFELGEINVKVDAATITMDVVIVNEVAVQDPKVTYELGAGAGNIEIIANNVERFAGGGGAGAKFIIEHIYLRGGTLRVSAAALGGRTMTFHLPEIHLTDIGKDQGGANPTEIAATVMAALTGKIAGFVSGLDISSVLEGAANVPASLMGSAGGAGQKRIGK